MQHFLSTKRSLIAMAVSAVLMTGCGGDSNSNDSADGQNNDATSVQHDLTKMQDVLNTNADIALAAYNDSVDTAQALLDAIVAFRQAPTSDNLNAAKKAWLVAREPYGQTEVYRFRLSPIDSTDYSDEDGPEGDINAWPLGEALIDYVQTNDSDFGTDEIGVTEQSTGVNGGGAITATDAANQSLNIIGTTAITIDESLLANNATADDEHDVISGYHAIEFLLWGQDLKDGEDAWGAGVVTDGTDRDEAVKVHDASNETSTTNGGQRSILDFAVYDMDGSTCGTADTTCGGYDGSTTGNMASYDSSNPKHRRLKYLEVAAEKLVDDLTTVRNGWQSGASYRTAFTTVSSVDEAKAKMLEIVVGMGTLAAGELAGERMQIALLNNSQEDEHSCFSDNTHRDVWLNAEGVSNAYYGQYAGYDSTLDAVDDNTTRAVDGYGIYDYLNDVGLTTLAEEVKTKMTTTENGYKAIDTAARDGKPFDVLIKDFSNSDGEVVGDTIIALTAEAKAIVKINDQLGLGDYSYDDAIDDTSCANGEDNGNLCN